MKPFQDQVAVITGAGEGIGFEIARRLSLAGAAVVLNDIREDAAADAAAKIRDEGGEHCIPCAGDASDVEHVQELVALAVAEFGRIDLCIANAGVTLYGDFFEYPPERLESLLNVNIRGTFFLIQAAARQMREQKSGGSILMTSSVTGHQAVKFLGTYGMTKAALEMLARNLVIELSPHDIAINCIAPGPIVTPRNLADDPNYEANWAAVTPVNRAGSVADVAQAALFFLDPNNRYITGQSLVIDGGWSCVSKTPELDFGK